MVKLVVIDDPENAAAGCQTAEALRQRHFLVVAVAVAVATALALFRCFCHILKWIPGRRNTVV